MKDFISKFTFGFVMAQLFPGAIAVLGSAVLVHAASPPRPTSFVGSVLSILESWGTLDVPYIALLLAVFVGAGMLIHGLHWAVLGYLESRYETFSRSPAHWRTKKIEAGSSEPDGEGVPLWWQILRGPVMIILEVGQLTFLATDISKVSIEENAPQVSKDLMPQFEFLQEFYLYSAQFFAHTGYALLVMLTSVVTFIAWNGFTPHRAGIGVALYLAIGVFFVLGRIQLETLFKAEEEIVRRSGWASVAETME